MPYAFKDGDQVEQATEHNDETRNNKQRVFLRYSFAFKGSKKATSKKVRQRQRVKSSRQAPRLWANPAPSNVGEENEHKRHSHPCQPIGIALTRMSNVAVGGCKGGKEGDANSKPTHFATANVEVV